MLSSEVYGDMKCDLVDYLAENSFSVFDYGASPRELVIELSRIFDVKIKYIGKKKSRRVLSKFFDFNDFSAGSFGYCYEMSTRYVDQEDVMRARQALGDEEYFKALGFYRGEMKGEEVLVLVLANSKVFYQSPEWKRVRYQALRVYKNFCQCCGRKRSENLQLHVDHIKPRSLRPDLALALTNLQILCAYCNEGKSNIDWTDWRDDKIT